MSITASAVNQLRKMTGAGMMDCKKALQETNGDMEAAIDFLRKKGQKISAKRADRDATEGAVIAKTNDGNTYGVIVKVSCETDFVAKNDEFVALAHDLADLALEHKPSDAAAMGALSYRETTVTEALVNEMGKIGEKIELAQFDSISGEAVAAYIHAGNKIGVLVELTKGGEESISAGKDVAMQAAAMNPVSVDENDVPEDVKQRELEIGREQAKAEGKPEQILDKIAQGKLQRFYKDNTLANQTFVKDPSKSVAAMLKDIDGDLAIKKFSRIALG